jgi:hypothetical protein
LATFVAQAELKPLAVDDIRAYIAKRAPGVSDETRRELAKMLGLLTHGRPADVSSAIDLYLASNTGS